MLIPILATQDQDDLSCLVPLIERFKGGAVPNIAPVAGFSSVVTLLSVAFTDTSTDADGSVAGWDWDWGDSTTHGTTQNPTHVYSVGGTYTVTLTTTDNLGATNAISHSVTAHAAPAAGFSSVAALLSVTFTDTSTADATSGATIVGWDWDWGDSTTHGTTQNPTHPYTTNGSKTVTLTVTDSFGATNAVSHSVSPDITKDGPSSTFRVPLSAADFTAIGVTAPTDLYLMQEASGNLADTLAAALTLTAAGSVAYQQAVTSWTRKAIQTAETSGQKWTVAAASGPNPSSTSVAFGFYFTLTGTPGGSRDVAGVQGANGVKAMVNGSRQLVISCLSVTTTGASAYTAGTVYRAILVYNRTAATVKLFTDLETITGTYGAGAVDGIKGFGSLGGTAPGPLKFLLGWIASGATAEGYSASTLALM